MTAHTITEALKFAEEAQAKHPKGPRKPITKAQAVAAEQFGERPYILESANLEAEMHRQRMAAASEIEAINAAIADINDRAERDIDAIRQRAAAEITGRNNRVDDLHKILTITSRALDLPAAATISENQP